MSIKGSGEKDKEMEALSRSGGKYIQEFKGEVRQ